MPFAMLIGHIVDKIGDISMVLTFSSVQLYLGSLGNNHGSSF